MERILANGGVLLFDPARVGSTGGHGLKGMDISTLYICVPSIWLFKLSVTGPVCFNGGGDKKPAGMLALWQWRR